MLKLLKDAYYYGITYDDFWSCTPNELLYMIDGVKDRMIDSLDDGLYRCYENAYLTAVGINNGRSFPKKPNSIRRVYGTQGSVKTIVVSDSNYPDIMDELEDVIFKKTGKCFDDEILEITIKD